jgi:hypothetical protein
VSLRGATLAAGDGDRTVTLWDIRMGRMDGPPLTDHPDGVSKAVLSDEATTWLAGSARHLVLWDTASRRQLGHCTIEGPALALDRWTLALAPRGEVAAVARHDRKDVIICTPQDERGPR